MFTKSYSGIRDHIISKSMCVCGAKNILADDLLPNKTLRDTINRILEGGGNSSAENAGSTFQVQGLCLGKMTFISIITM
jgi:E3 ubiquitin-protein ligase RBBP6